MKLGNPKFISTGCDPLDMILGGGVRPGEVTLIYGKPGIGKTSLAMQCALGFAEKDSKIIFIDSGNTFSLNRLRQMAGNDLEKVSPLIFIVKPRNFQEQSLIVENLESYNVKNIALIIVDTITSLYSIELGLTDKIFALNMKLNRQLAYLNEYARSHNISVLLTSQVRSIVRENTESNKLAPVATRILKFWSQEIINLEATSETTVKKATLEIVYGHREKITCAYSIDSSGIIKI